MPIANRLLFELMNTMKTAADWPTYPSQLVAMMRMAGDVCGLPDNPPAIRAPNAGACIAAQGRKVGASVVAGLRDAIGR